MLRSAPNANRDCGALVYDARNIDRPAVQLHQLVHERKPDARAFCRARVRSLTAVESLEHARQVCFGNSTTGVPHFQHDPFGLRAEPNPHFAAERELECVGDEVEDDLFPHVAVDEHGLRKLRALHDQLQLRALEGGAEQADEIRGFRGEIRRFEGNLHAAGLDAGEVEHRLHELQQPGGCTARGLQQLAIVCAERAVGKHIVQRTQQQGERRAELMADIAQE